MQNRGLTIIELAAIIALLAILALLVLPALSKSGSRHRPSCQNNLKQWGLVFKMYANESKGEFYPPMQTLSANKSQFTVATGPAVATIYPEYLTDPSITICPTDAGHEFKDLQDTADCDNDGDVHEFILDRYPELIDVSYAYFGYVFDKMDHDPVRISKFPMFKAAIPHLTGIDKTPAEFMPEGMAAEAPTISPQIGAAFETLLRNTLEKPKDIKQLSENPGRFAELIDDDIENVFAPGEEKTSLGNHESTTIHRLREGIGKFFVTDINNPGSVAQAQSDTWIMLDQIGPSGDPLKSNHIPAGSNVLYLDGHVDYVGFPNPPDPKIQPPVTASFANTLSILSADSTAPKK